MKESEMERFIPHPGTKFRWRSAIIDVCLVAEHYGLSGIGDKTMEHVQQALVDIDQRLFADAFGPTRLASLTEDQEREWLQCALEACKQGITEFRPEPSAEQKERTKVVEQNRPEFTSAWAALRALDVSAVLVAFSGAGDSGEILSIEPVFQEEPDSIPTDAALADATAAFRSAEVPLPTAAPAKLGDLVRKLSDNLLMFPEVPDWYNNDGGYGMLVWRLHPSGKNELKLTVDQYVTHTRRTRLIYDEFGSNYETSEGQVD
jgi:hypothetical protein